MARALKNTICDAALKAIGTGAKPSYFRSMLRRVTARRQHEIAQLMAAYSDYSLSFLTVLVFASKGSDFFRPKRRMRGLGRGDLALIENIMAPLEKGFWTAAKAYADDARALMVTEAYVRRILANPAVAAYVAEAHPAVLRDLMRFGFKRAEKNPIPSN